MRQKLAAGNWKMNGDLNSLSELPPIAASAAQVEVLICPPAPLIQAARAAAPELLIGAQDCHARTSGAHTGDISAALLANLGASHVILGHSERRADHGEKDEDVRAKCACAIDAGLTAIVCVGETLAEREAQNTLDIIGGQLAGSVPDEATAHTLVIAYEPVWAIGTGKVPTMDQIGEVHDFIRARLERRFGAGIGRSTRLLYGGSVKAGNAADIFAVSNVDGALVGGASLKASDFIPIIDALNASA